MRLILGVFGIAAVLIALWVLLVARAMKDKT